MADGVTFHVVDVFLTELKKVHDNHVSFVVVVVCMVTMVIGCVSIYVHSCPRRLLLFC